MQSLAVLGLELVCEPYWLELPSHDMEASHVHKSPCAGPRFLYSLVCYNPDRDDIKHGHPLLGFQHLHMRVRILNFYITIVAYSLAMVQPFYLEHHFQGRTY